MTSRHDIAAAAAVGTAYGLWGGLAVPASALYRLGEPLSVALWHHAPAIADALEPASRAIPPFVLTALGPGAALVTAVLLLPRRPAMGAAALLGSASWGLAPLRDVVDVVLSSPNLTIDFSSLADFYGGSLIAGGLSLLPLAIPAIRKSLIIAPIRRARNTRRDATAGWAPPELVRHLAAAGGMPLGRVGRDILRYPSRDPSEILYQGHHFIIAATRSGKGVGAVIPAILDHTGPVTCIDIKGENFAVCRAAREAMGYKVVALNPFNVLELGGISLNPLDFISRDDMDSGAGALAVSLIREEAGTGGADHFIRLARALVAAAIEVVMTVAEPHDRHLVTVLDVICGPGAANAFAEWIKSPDLCGGRPARAVASFMGHDTKERDMVISTVRANIGFIGGDKMQSFFTASQNNMVPDDLLNGKTDVFIIMPLEQITAQQNFFRLVVSLFVNTIIGSKARKLSSSMLMVLDEFPVLGAMDQIKDLFTIGAGSNIQLLTIAQDIARLRDVWGHNGAQSLLAQSASIRVLGLGAGDIDTAKFVSELLPRIAIRREGTSFDGADVTMDRANYSESDKPLMTPDEILKMPSGKGLCILRGHNPVMTDKIVYYKDRNYQQRAGKNPYSP